MIINEVWKEIGCDGEREGQACENKVRYQEDPQGRGIKKEIVDANPWLKNVRTVILPTGQAFVFCSDLCMVGAIEKDLFNFKEPQVVQEVTGGGAAALAEAAATARKRDLAEKAIKEGSGITITG